MSVQSFRRRQGQRCERNERGFSMVELLVVLVILAVIIGARLPWTRGAPLGRQ